MLGQTGRCLEGLALPKPRTRGAPRNPLLVFKEIGRCGFGRIVFEEVGRCGFGRTLVSTGLEYEKASGQGQNMAHPTLY